MRAAFAARAGAVMDSRAVRLRAASRAGAVMDWRAVRMRAAFAARSALSEAAYTRFSAVALALSRPTKLEADEFPQIND